LKHSHALLPHDRRSNTIALTREIQKKNVKKREKIKTEKQKTERQVEMLMSCR